MSSQSLLQMFNFLEKTEVVFVENIPERLKCILCNNILKNAKQTSCGCKVCESCIRNYLGDIEKVCPSKQLDCQNTRLSMNRDIHQDNATNKEISNLDVKCPFINCKVIDKIKNMVSHVDICEYREIQCNKCQKKYPYKEKDVHNDQKCEERIVICIHCKESMTDLIMRTIHLNTDGEDLCSKYNDICPNGCGDTVVLLREHLLECKNKKLDCPLKSIQCFVGKLTRIKLLDHLRDESVSHLNVLVKEIMIQKNFHESLERDVKGLKNDLKKQMDNNQELTKSRIKAEKSIEELKRKGPGTASSAEKNVVFRNASYIWKIQHFETLKSDAETGGRASLSSDPFYTSEFGYKMCLRIYPAGDGVGRGNHLSVFFALMKGDYDDILSWPFKQKVTLSLLDQVNNGAKNHSDTFKPDARSACYQKPIDDCNIASGSPKFITLASISPNSVYCQDDTIYLKISVDTMGISKP